jgi:hypothetical protein
VTDLDEALVEHLGAHKRTWPPCWHGGSIPTIFPKARHCRRSPTPSKMTWRYTRRMGLGTVAGGHGSGAPGLRDARRLSREIQEHPRARLIPGRDEPGA